jgi:spermidine synthase
LDDASYTTDFRRPLSAIIFFVSGAAGMVYEISWARQFGNVFGHTVYTGAMVLASFLGGMAVGYWLAGKHRGQWHPLTTYGALEVLAAAWACVVPWLLSLSEMTILGSLEAGPGNSYAIARVVFCCLALLPTTAALGATWPMMAAVLSPSNSPSARWLSVGYALNTAGAMVGSVLATAFLLVEVGVTKSSYLAAAVSAICGLLAMVLARRFPVTDLARIQNGSRESEFLRIQLQDVWPWWLLASLSGFSILALEVLYLRLFSLVFHNSTYTFGAVVTVFLLALAVGSSLA